jgi:polyferredoxin/Flp pilus assembly protein TadD
MKPGCTSKKQEKPRSISLPVLPQATPQKEEIAHSKTSKWRALSLILLYLLMIAHFIQWRMMGSTVSPIEPSESMYTLQQGAINAGVIFFSLALLATLIFGRFVCGWGCHIVALQDFCSWGLKKFGLTPKPFRSRLLVYVPLIAALYMFVWPTVSRALTKPKDAPLIPGFTNHLITTEFWATFPPIWVAIPFLFICGFMTVLFLGSKGFCTYACPYGGLFGPFDKIAPGKIRVTDACNQCGHCTATCTSNVLVHQEVKQYGMVVDPGCMKCMDCVSVCPNDALYFGFGKPAVGVKSSITRSYSLTWPEEIFAAIVFAASYLAVWDTYQAIPMLMALGIAAITTFLVLKTWKLLSTKHQSFYRFSLKSSGKFQPAGWIFLVFAMSWVGLVVHSGWVRYHESIGANVFADLKIPDELALARANPVRWLSASDQTNITEGKRHFNTAVNNGLLTNAYALQRLAWFEYLSGNTKRAIDLLGTAAEHHSGQTKALSLSYRGAMLNRLGRYDEALVSLDEALIEAPDLLTAREERGESLWQLGRKQEAVAAWRDAVGRNAGLPLAHSFLAGAAASEGKGEEAADHEKRAAQYTPDDPLFHWMLGLRLQNVGMNALVEKHFARAIELNPEFRKARN